MIGLRPTFVTRLGARFTFTPFTRNMTSASTSDTATGASEKAEATFDEIPKLIVLGGSGFLGSRVCHEALNTGLHVVGVSRSGAPPLVREPWTQQVEWVRGDALEPESYAGYLKGALGVISCVGGFGNNAQMWKTNGTANVRAVESAKAAGVPRFVYVSAFIPNLPGLETVMEGYVKGKRQAELALRQNFPESGVILRPGAIYGSRAISETVSLPLQYFFQPLERVLSFVPSKQISGIPIAGAAFVPPVSAETVARAAVRAATDGSFPAGILDPWDLKQFQ